MLLFSGEAAPCSFPVPPPLMGNIPVPLPVQMRFSVETCAGLSHFQTVKRFCAHLPFENLSFLATF